MWSSELPSWLESLGDEAVKAYKATRRKYDDDPGTIIAHRVQDGLWFEWRGGPVAMVSHELWRDRLYAMNDRGELPWVLLVLAIDGRGDYFVCRASHEELEAMASGSP